MIKDVLIRLREFFRELAPKTYAPELPKPEENNDDLYPEVIHKKRPKVKIKKNKQNKKKKIRKQTRGKKESKINKKYRNR